MNKILKAMIIFYRNTIPVFVRQGLYNLELRITCWYNPLLKNRVTRYAIEDLFEACKKELANKNNSDLINHNLQKVFSKHMVRANLIDSQWWSDFILLISLPSGSKFEKINKSLINRIEHSNFNSLYHFEILHIYSLSIRFGLFELGYHLREKSLNIALGYSKFTKKKDAWKLKSKLSALLEKENFFEFDQLLPLLNRRWKKEILVLKNLRIFLGGDKNILNERQNLLLNTKQDESFYEFIQNKKIIIVSPSPVSDIDGFKIDNSTDIIIRTRYMSKYSPEDLLIKGSRCDITYIYADHSKYISDNGCKQWPSDISWIIGKAPSQSENILKRLSNDGHDIKNLKGRSIQRIDKALFYGGLHSLPNIIIDILRFNPKKIFLYHFDMMLTKKRVDGYTPEYLQENNDTKYLVNKRLNGLAGHDPITQFVIMKAFWKKGIVDGDLYFQNVIKMDIENYMKNLQKNYREDENVEID